MVQLRPAFATLAALLVAHVSANVLPEKRAPLQAYDSLAGRSQEEIEEFFRRNDFPIVGAQPIPPPPTEVGAKLVNDAAHPYVAPGPGDMRGPCPAMNSLANHGYLSHTGVDTPQNLILAAMEGYNIGWDLCVFTTMLQHVLGGNLLTNLISIGTYSPLVGPLDPNFPNALMEGVAAHNNFEGDGSQSRQDHHFGEYLNFHEETWEHMLKRCDEYDGYYNFTSAAKIRRDGYERSRSTNPMLLYDAPRYMTSGGEAVFPIGMWQDGRALAAGEPLTCRSLLPFYNHSRFPDDFWRRDGQFGFAQLFPGVMKLKMVNTENGVHMLEAGHNEGLGNFIKTPADLQTMLDTNPPCALYRWACRRLTDVLYPGATGQLLQAIKDNYAQLYPAMMFRGAQPACPQLFPFEQPCPQWEGYF